MRRPLKRIPKLLKFILRIPFSLSIELCATWSKKGNEWYSICRIEKPINFTSFSYDNCIDDCDAAIELDKLCVKAYYRRMQANESLGNNMEALKDCTTVLAIDPKNYEAKRSLERINDRLRKIGIY